MSQFIGCLCGFLDWGHWRFLSASCFIPIDLFVFWISILTHSRVSRDSRQSCLFSHLRPASKGSLLRHFTVFSYSWRCMYIPSACLSLFYRIFFTNGSFLAMGLVLDFFFPFSSWLSLLMRLRVFGRGKHDREWVRIDRGYD